MSITRPHDREITVSVRLSFVSRVSFVFRLLWGVAMTRHVPSLELTMSDCLVIVAQYCTALEHASAQTIQPLAQAHGSGRRRNVDRSFRQGLVKLTVDLSAHPHPPDNDVIYSGRCRHVVGPWLSTRNILIPRTLVDSPESTHPAVRCAGNTQHLRSLMCEYRDSIHWALQVVRYP